MSNKSIESLEVFTLDTKKLFPEIHAYHRDLENFFALSINKYVPDPAAEVKLRE